MLLCVARARVCVQWTLVNHVVCVLLCVCSGNQIGPEGATALGPHLGKLLNMHTFILACTHGLSCLLTACGSVGDWVHVACVLLCHQRTPSVLREPQRWVHTWENC